MHSIIKKTANALRFVAAAGAIATMLPTAHAAVVVQTIAPAASHSDWRNPWQWIELGSVTLGQGTNQIVGLTSSVTLVDQGWGGMDPQGNHAVIGLYDGDTQVWIQHVAGAHHDWRTETFDIATDPAALGHLNDQLGAIDWTAQPTVQMRMYAVPISYPGWELRTSNASFTVVSAAVPEPSSAALVALALLAGCGATHRRRKLSRAA